MVEPKYYYLRAKAVEKMLCISRATRERMVREGTLPKPYKLGKRCVAWRSNELEKAMANFPRIDDAYLQNGRRSSDKEIILGQEKKDGNFHAL
jgi:Predicted transcriptional regulator